MKVLLLLTIISSIVSARDFRLKCTLEYDIDDKEEIEIPMTLVDGVPTFHIFEDKLITYYIPLVGNVAQWHNDSTIEFYAELIGENLIYTYDFKNYLRDESELVSVYKETRSYRLDFEEIDDAEIHYFDFDDGEIIDSNINQDDWINETGIEIDDCEIYDADLRRRD